VLKKCVGSSRTLNSSGKKKKKPREKGGLKGTVGGKGHSVVRAGRGRTGDQGRTGRRTDEKKNQEWGVSVVRGGVREQNNKKRGISSKKKIPFLNSIEGRPCKRT